MYELITKTQERKIESGENKDTVREWSVEIESDISKYENRLTELEETMDKQNQIRVEKTKLDLQKLEAEMQQQMFEGIKGDLVHTDDNWQQWKFCT